jgi:ABC-2 type transport system permease protein
MKLREVCRFELVYQLRRPWPWLAFAVMVIFAFENIRSGIMPVTLPQDFILNSPFIITSITVFSCLIWLLVASPMAGEAAARDLQTGMHPLTYTMPLSKRQYLGGRFLAAFVLNLFVLLGVQIGCILGVYFGGVDPEIIGPFRIAAHLAAFGFIAIPNAFIATTLQFSFALISARAMAAYFGSVLLVFFTVPVPFVVYFALGKPAIAKMLDPIGLIAIMNEMMAEWTVVEKNVRMFTLHGPMLWNRVMWVTIAIAAVLVMHMRFRFAHRTLADPLTRLRERFRRKPAIVSPPAPTNTSVAVPVVHQNFGWTTRAQQVLSIAWSSLWMILKSPAGFFMLVIFPALLVLVTYAESEQWGIALTPRTGYILTKHLIAPITYAADYRLMIPLLLIFFAGEIVWRERDAGLNEHMDTTSLPDAVLLLGKFLGLGLIISAYLIVLMLVGMTTQVLMGYYNFEIGLYLQILFGFQLPEYLLFAMLAMMIQVVVNQKYVALLLTLVIYTLIIFSTYIGIDHNLFVYGAAPGWGHTDIRGFVNVGPWLWFKFYWAAWALLLAVAARLWWVRGRESGFAPRMRIARRRFAGSTIGAASLAVVLIITLGGFIFYNTNVLNEFITDEELVRRRAAYERVYGAYEGKPQPSITDTRLSVDIFPDRGEATLKGSYRLVNRHSVPIREVHIEPAFHLETKMQFDRAARVVVADDTLGHHIYALADPLQPGDSLTLHFDVKIGRPGFRNAGVRASGAGRDIVRNGSYFTNGSLPTIGYSPMRELWSSDERRKYGLPRQVTVQTPSDVDPRMAAGDGSTFDAVISTSADQVAVAPGELRRSWSAGGRRYFHYASDIPIGGMHYFWSAKYKVHREQRNGVDVQVYVHPDHARHLDRLLGSVRAALDYNSAQFAPYPYRFLQIVEQPGNFLGMGVDGSGVITGGEGFFLLDPKRDGFDAIFEIVGHEMGHQWWAVQLRPAMAEGGGVISEGLAWYSSMQLVKNVKGREALRRFMSMMRQPSPWPPIRTGHPLLRAIDPWANYRKGPYAFYALSEYIGEDRVNGALKALIERKKGSLATTLDMYREFQAVTPDSLKPLLADLFERNVFWKFDTKKSTARQLPDGKWEVTFDLEAKKTVLDSAGVEKDAPITEPIEIGVFAGAAPGEMLGRPLYLQKHRIRAGMQRVKIVVAEKPARGGIDPYSLLDWEEGDNIEGIEIVEDERK